MAKKKSKHGGARQGAGSLPRLDKVGNCLRIVRLEADGSEAKGFAQPLYHVVEKGRGYAILEDYDGTRFKLELATSPGILAEVRKRLYAAAKELATIDVLVDYDADVAIAEED